MEKMRMETPDWTSENIEMIGELFPNCITETKDDEGNLRKAINFDVLKQMLSRDILEGSEAYEFTWVGKKASMVEANRPIKKTLRPCKEESLDWDNTENLYIEGDNLEVLKLLQESYLKSIQMIYIDPPYNTGSDFIYNDNFKMSRTEYNQQSGVLDDEYNKLFKNTDSNGRFHSDWCSMMYSRLLLARNLLSEDGLIFISIDDNEQENLKKICDEIFGEDQFVAKLTIKTGDVYGAKAAHVNSTFVKIKDYILIYQNHLGFFRKKQPLYDKLVPFYDPHYSHILMENKKIVSMTDYIKNDIFFRDKFNKYKLDINKNNINSLLTLDSEFKTHFIDRISDKLYKDSQYNNKLSAEVKSVLKADEAFDNEGTLLIVTSGGTVRHLQAFRDVVRLSDDYIPEYTRTIPRGDLWDGFVKDMGNVGKEGGVSFKNGKKPVRLIKQLFKWGNFKNCTILDFFSGSSTTAHSVMELNAEDGGRRKFIMVQLPEPTDEKSEAYINGLINICELGKERIRRAGKKIKESNKQNEEVEALDIGFRVLKVGESNMKDIYYSPNDVSQGILDYLESNIKEDRDDLDLLFGCLLEWGLPLSRPYTYEEIGGVTVHNYNEGDLIACFDKDIPREVIENIARRKPLRVVFRDSSFKDSPDKINVEEIFKLLAPDTSIRVL